MGRRDCQVELGSFLDLKQRSVEVPGQVGRLGRFTVGLRGCSASIHRGSQLCRYIAPTVRCAGEKRLADRIGRKWPLRIWPLAVEMFVGDLDRVALSGGVHLPVLARGERQRPLPRWPSRPVGRSCSRPLRADIARGLPKPPEFTRLRSASGVARMPSGGPETSNTSSYVVECSGIELTRRAPARTQPGTQVGV